MLTFNKTITIVYSLLLMAACGVFSWTSTMFFGIPTMIEPTLIVVIQNFMNKIIFNIDTTTGIS